MADAHTWGGSTFAGGWSATTCDACGICQMGSTKARDVLAIVWPTRFGCSAIQRRNAQRRLVDREMHEHTLMLASDTQLIVRCQDPDCDYEGMYVGNPLTLADVERLTGTKAAT